MNDGGASAGGSSSSGAGGSGSKAQPQQTFSSKVAADGRSAQPSLHLSSDEVNYLIYRYMQESGFVHSSFTFVYESMLGRSNMKNAERSIPPGALVSFLQKGLQYVGIEETLHREHQQRGNVNSTSSNKKSKSGNTSSSNNSGSASLGGGASSTDATIMNLSLLSPTTINAMTRETAPLHLNVPPATAAAAVRARVEAENKIAEDRKQAAIMEAKAKSEAQSNGKSSNRWTGPQSIPPQASVTLTNPLSAVTNSAHSAMDAQAAKAAALSGYDIAEINELQQQQQQRHGLLVPQNNPLPQHQQQQQEAQSQQRQQQQESAAKSSVNAAALMARDIQQREHMVQLQLRLQLQQEQEKHYQKLRQDSLKAAAQAKARGIPVETMPGINTAQAAVALASVAEQMGNNMNNSSSNNNSNSSSNNNAATSNGSNSSSSASNKRSSSAKKGPKNKGKSPKQQKTSQQQQQPQVTTKGESNLNLPTPSPAAPQNNGLASLEAAAQLEAKRGMTESAAGAKHLQQVQYQQQQQEQQQQQQQQQQQDVVMTDSGQPSGAVVAGDDNDHRQHHRHLQHPNLRPNTPTYNILDQMQQLPASELSSHQAAAVSLQKLISMNGNHVQGEIQNFNGTLEPQQPLQQTTASPNVALSAPKLQAVLSAATTGPNQPHQPVVATQVAPKEAAKAQDALIDKEDERTNAKPSEVLELKMHQSEVFMCAWNSVFTDTIATGSGDASARIWKMGGPKAGNGLGVVKLLPHGTGPKDKKNKDVTTLEWSSDGRLLATGSYDGVARVWSLEGNLVHTLRGHKGPIFSLKWNKTGNYLLSGSYDKTTIVWDVSTSEGFIKQQFQDHQAPALDVDWKDDDTFASCSTDKTVHICRVGEDVPLKTYTGHTDEVNAVKWDPSGCLLASCSDDCTAKVWDVRNDRKDPMYDFKDHQQEIYTVKWAPTGPGSMNPKKKPLLATASFDGSVRLWNVQDGSCIQVFSRHRDSVYSVAFSPSGNYLASGSLAGQLYVWNVTEGRHIKSFKGKGDIFEVAWNKEETRVAACFSSNVVCILDFP